MKPFSTVKVADFFIPSGYILNDNVRNDYRSNMGKMNWLTKQTELGVAIANGEEPSTPTQLCFVTPKVSVPIEGNSFGIVINHIKIGNKSFDLLNYERSMKPTIDVLTANGYWSDDNCKVCNPAIMIGGSSKSIATDPFGILASEGLTSNEAIIAYFTEHIDPWWFTRSKYTKVTDYDLFQIHAFTVG